MSLPQSWNCWGVYLIRRRLCGIDREGMQAHPDDPLSTQSFGEVWPFPLALGRRLVLRSGGVWEALSAPKFTIPLGFLPLPRREWSEQASSWALPCSKTRPDTPLLLLEGGGWDWHSSEREGVGERSDCSSTRTIMIQTLKSAPRTLESAAQR